jgi:hypothetical protein
MIGAIFCTVRNIQSLFQFKPFLTFGIHMWSGAKPLFNKRLIISKIGEYIKKLILLKVGNIIFIVIEDKMKIDLIVWIRKYFKSLSLVLLFLDKTINLNDLNSKNAQIKIQFLIVIAPIGAIIRIIHIMIYKKVNFQRGMSPLAFIAYLISYIFLFSFFLFFCSIKEKKHKDSSQDIVSRYIKVMFTFGVVVMSYFDYEGLIGNNSFFYVKCSFFNEIIYSFN